LPIVNNCTQAKQQKACITKHKEEPEYSKNKNYDYQSPFSDNFVCVAMVYSNTNNIVLNLEEKK